ncbi:MAG: V-type ATP synthase subunit F [Saccharofermentans sp.]|jgi:V/A-type H+-transporting ATPase subunit F|nr:V-type ATP synthase subunit F [Mageeibacillus sp.]MCI1263758.1 V-type ATP synthase subunit F [Saccharofermentans sp.]MCI1274776.1 V-type ATP synthase subunit F [Saccharofermentans sp.]MCI1769206.1 V-type ATP synthase subunit F [Mageeibacillus sp.]MCI2044578.1 V-type ATP synthase subunit F [Mageeibacillus sp.]
MSKVAVIGDYDSIYGFAAIGLATFPVVSSEAASKCLRQISENGYDIIFITENYYALLGRDVERYQETMTPAVLPIPGVVGNNGSGVLNVKSNVKRAVGSDILFGED